MIRSRFLDREPPLAFAHRGGAETGLENTMTAFEAAVALGYTYLETDVHLTSDGVVVAFHDAELDRLTDRSGRITELPWPVVRRASVAGRERIPLLEELLGTWPDVYVNIDAKHDAVVPALIEVLRRTASAERVCLASFSERRVEAMRSTLPGVVTGLGARAVARLWTRAIGLPMGRIRGHCVQVPPRVGMLPVVTEGFVHRAHRLGMQVHVWTVDDPGEMERLLDLGVDGIMTDRPSTLKEVLERRGAWRG